MTAVVFGAEGQVGRALTALASRRAVAVRGVSRTEADITDVTSLAAVFGTLRPAIAVNCAAYTAVDRAEHESALAERVNTDGARNLAAQCAAFGVPLIHLSTDYVFDGTKPSAYDEADLPRPINVYGRTKWEGEEAIRELLPDHVILRTSWVYSAHGNNFLKTISRLARERDELRIVADQFGCPTAAADVAEAVLAAAEKLSARQALAGTYHFAGQTRMSWHEFGGEIVRQQSHLTGRQPKVTPITTAEYPTPAERPRNSALNSGLFAKTFGYTARPWQERVAETLAALFNSARGTS